MRPKMGPPGGLEEDSQSNLVAYIDYCTRMGIPRSEKMLSAEIVHFLKERKLANKFRTGSPGTAFFQFPNCM